MDRFAEVLHRMERLRARAGFAACCLTLLAGCGEGPLLPQDEVTAVTAAMDAWVARHPDGWAGAVTTTTPLTRPDWTPSCADPANINGYVSLRLATDRGDIELAFRCPLGEHATVAQLQETFLHAIPGNLPIGLVADHWRFQPLLPLNAVFNGVTFHEPTPGQFAIDIASEMDGIRGTNVRRACAADGAPAALCRVDRAHHVPLWMRFTVPADLSTLR